MGEPSGYDGYSARDESYRAAVKAVLDENGGKLPPDDPMIPREWKLGS